jgi:hypothetical protein
MDILEFTILLIIFKDVICSVFICTSQFHGPATNSLQWNAVCPLVPNAAAKFSQGLRFAAYMRL